MKLWQAWIAGFVATAVLTISLNELTAATGIAEEFGSPLLVAIIIAAIWFVGSFGPALVAYRKGRRWWLWLIFGLMGQYVSLFAVSFAQLPLLAISAEDREALLDYYQKITGITAFQTQEADVYNSALTIHMNNLNEPQSANVMFDASERLSKSAKETIKRHGDISPIPELAGADYAAWGLTLFDYAAWADAQRDVFEANAQGLVPHVARVQELMATSERQRRIAEQEGKKLLQILGLVAGDLPRIFAAGQQEDDWEPDKLTNRDLSSANADSLHAPQSMRVAENVNNQRSFFLNFRVEYIIILVVLGTIVYFLARGSFSDRYWWPLFTAATAAGLMYGIGRDARRHFGTLNWSIFYRYMYKVGFPGMFLVAVIMVILVGWKAGLASLILSGGLNIAVPPLIFRFGTCIQCKSTVGLRTRTCPNCGFDFGS